MSMQGRTGDKSAASSNVDTAFDPEAQIVSQSSVLPAFPAPVSFSPTLPVENVILNQQGLPPIPASQQQIVDIQNQVANLAQQLASIVPLIQ